VLDSDSGKREFVRRKKRRTARIVGRARTPDARHRRDTRRAWRSAIPIAALGVAILLAVHFGPRFADQTPPQATPPNASFVGSGTCAACHPSESAEWNRSQHHAAMAKAGARTVLGRFDGARFTYAGTTSEFLRRDSNFVVRTDGPDGKLNDFGVKYTFGVAPLQQYLIELPGGRLQALSIAWDSRSRSRNGQRWFHLYPNERVTSRDELHWTRPSQNWNFMCADCHSTGVRKNYDREADRFATKWAEISVGCEACHGPASRHIEWARAADRDSRDSAKGLNTRLDERRGVAWIANAVSGNATRSRPRASDREIETCAQCHSRRSQIADGYEAGRPFLDYYRPALLSRPLYHADGQQRDEVYIWGSFLQSRMYAHGVTCSDCHNPHSGTLRAQGNAVCATCHLPAKYDTPAHHHHETASAGATCTGCHMPTTTYMVVDPRHDHSLRIPRPDLSMAFGTPNACTSCHTQRDAKWAAARMTAWYGGTAPAGPHERLAAALAAADAGASDAQTLLRGVASDTTQPAIARATALAELNFPRSGGALSALANGLHDPNALVRFGALQSVAQLPVDSRLSLAEPLLSDATRAIRMEAARVLAAVPQQHLSPTGAAAFERAAEEYVETQRYNADRAEARVNLGTFFAERGDLGGAEAELRSAIRMEPSSIPAYVNLADVYRAMGRDAEGERLLRDGLTTTPNSGVLHFALGLVLTRLDRGDTALREFARAAGLEPGNARFAYVHAIALHSAGKVDAAIERLKSALIMHPGNGDIIAALVKFHEARGDSAQARRYANQLRAMSTNR
jgi:Tfp pilus assembly protein PilF/formate-dependent nitrite reductase cytochrome c552 subunit